MGPACDSALLMIVMLTWVKGSAILSGVSRKGGATLDWLVKTLEKKSPHRVNGTAVFLTAHSDAAPTALLHNLKHNHMLHERNIVLTFKTADVPRVPNSERIAIQQLSETFTVVVLTYGFMEMPRIEHFVALAHRRGLNIDPGSTSFFLSRRVLRPTARSLMPFWQEKLFIWLADTSEDATAYFQIPSDRVVEIGTQIAV